MASFLPLLGAILQASSSVLDKVVLSVRRMDYRAYVGASFPIIFLVNTAIVLVLRPAVDIQAISTSVLIILAASIAINVCSNALYYRALQHDHLTELQTVELASRFPIILVVSYVFADERRLAVLLAALVAAAAIFWSHFDHHHIRFHRRTVVYLVWILLAVPWAAVYSKVLLYVFPPAFLEMIRNGVMALVFSLLYFRQEGRVSAKAFGLLVLLNTLSAFAWFFYFTSYQVSGVVYTMLFYSLQPLLVYFGAVLFLKERFEWKKFAAFVVVLAAIVAAEMFA